MKNIKFLLPLILLGLVFSCTTQQKITYLNDLGDTATFTLPVPPVYHIQNKDILYIRVYTLNKDMFDIMNGNSASSSQSSFNVGQNEGSTYVMGYTVNDSGKITLPLVGQVPVVGKTLDEVNAAVQQAVNKFLKDATVEVKLISFKFTVLGEVNRPGTYRNYNNQLTVLEAIGMAGDINVYGDRSHVIVLRSTTYGTKTYRFNLHKKDILQSEAFYLLPNDVVYVQPIKTKPFALNMPVISFFLTTLVSTLSLTLLVLKL